MNFLAHQYLSFHNPEIQIGNLYGEIVRGKDYLNFYGDLQKGILLHRQIDTFTDSHDIVKNSTRIFHAEYGKYAPVIVDVIYDYLLIKNWQKFSDEPFENFVSDCYQLFQAKLETFPPKLKYIVDHLLNYDWFHNYMHLDGIRQTLNGISQRSKFPNSIANSVVDFELNQNEIETDFLLFFPELVSHCQEFIKS